MVFSIKTKADFEIKIYLELIVAPPFREFQHPIGSSKVFLHSPRQLQNKVKDE
jgi:hypothetical protein